MAYEEHKVLFHERSIEITVSSESILDENNLLGGIVPDRTELKAVMNALSDFPKNPNSNLITVSITVGDSLNPKLHPILACLIYGAMMDREVCDCGKCRTSERHKNLRYTQEQHECLRRVAEQVIVKFGYDFVYGREVTVVSNGLSSIPLQLSGFLLWDLKDRVEILYAKLKSATYKHSNVKKKGDVIYWGLSWFWQRSVRICIDPIEPHPSKIEPSHPKTFSCLPDHHLSSQQATEEDFDKRYLKNCLILKRSENEAKDLYLRIHAETGERAFAIITKVSKKMQTDFSDLLPRINPALSTCVD
jgi:hypothetical protein